MGHYVLWACAKEVLLASAPAIAAAAGAALFLTHDRAGKRLVLGGNFPRELFRVLQGNLLSKIGGWAVQRTSLH